MYIERDFWLRVWPGSDDCCVPGGADAQSRGKLV